jgi:ComF family protein
MKKIAQLGQSVLNLFYPKTCACCSEPLLDQEKLICLTCLFDLPLVDNGDYTSNVVTRIFDGRVDIQYGASYLYYHDTGKAKNLIHQLKYQSRQDIGILFAEGLGHNLLQFLDCTSFDCIVPVPLHQKKLQKRGYNQLTRFGEKLGEMLQIPYVEDALQRVSFTNTQTKKRRTDRFQNTDSKFLLAANHSLDYQHILLIDDVVTTGATLEACCQELQKAQNAKISILTMAVTE